jgi:alkylation response protein AidB-like acyl-CoA dehydrogenase
MPIPQATSDDERVASVRETTRRFAEERVRPRAESLDETETFPLDLYRECAALGLFGITVAEAHGGLGADVRTYAAVMEELSRGYASVADQCGLIELVGTLLSTYGTPAQIARYVPPLVAFEKRCAYALTEAEAGSDLASLRTTA